MLKLLRDGRTDLVFDHVAQGKPATSADEQGTRLIEWCAYYGDVSGIRFLLANGESLASLGENLDLNGAAFHGHWQLCQFLVEHGADVNRPLPDTGETPLHAALCKANRPVYDHVIEILLAKGANPNAVTKPDVETGGFMRDCRTKGETPLHRAAAGRAGTCVRPRSSGSSATGRFRSTPATSPPTTTGRAGSDRHYSPAAGPTPAANLTSNFEVH